MGELTLLEWTRCPGVFGNSTGGPARRRRKALDSLTILSILTAVSWKIPNRIADTIRTTMAESRKRSYKAKQICDTFDISKATLFRWERQGLISGVGRDWRNWRIYSEKNCREIERLIRRRGNRRER
jgi:hypothetical protein